MKLDRFINRPVLSTVISILIVILGLIGLATLPITQYPDIAPPTVSVRATYQGANAQTVLNSVIAPLEDQINGVENMMYMTSNAANNGSADISIYFKQGTDPDMAAVNVQNRVSMAQGLLPAEVTRVGVTTQKRQTSMLMVFSIYDENDQYNIEFLENYANINLIPEIKRVNGVGDANVLGQDYSMRIWLKPERMAQYGLVPSDVTAVLGEQNIEAPTGSLGGSAGWINSAGSMIVNPGKFLASAVGSLTQSLFARGQVIAQYRIARARQEEASLVFRQTLLNAQLAQTANRFSEIQSLINLYKALGGGQE